MISRFLLLSACAFGLSGCGTASHMLGQASGLVNSITSPVLSPLGALRLADEAPAGSLKPVYTRPSGDAAVSETKR